MSIKRRLAVLLAASVVATALPLIVKPDPAVAHGAFVYPRTRTYACFLDGGAGGELNPTNPACAEAVRIGGKQPLWDWFGVLIGNAGGRHREIIPDGQLCGAGTTKYAGFNQARLDWPVNNLQSGAAITFRYNAWAPHPGTWTQYITKDGFDPSQPLKWSDLEEAPFDQITNPPTQNGESGNEYYWNARLPNKTGRHIIYSIWQRSDSAEAFYNCVDVNFGGGPDPDPTGNPTPTATPTANPTPTATPTTDPDPTGDCAATYRVVSAWNGGFQGEVTVRNNRASAIGGWTVSWTNPSGVSISQVWNGVATSSGSSISVRNASYNGTVAANGTTTFGFLGSGTSGAPSLTCATA